MSNHDEAEVIAGPEPPVSMLADLDPSDPVPPALDRAVLDEIRGRMRAENPRPKRRRTVWIAVGSSVAAAAAAVMLTMLFYAGPQPNDSMVAKGTMNEAVNVYLDFLVQHPGEESPVRMERDDELYVGDRLYLRAELDQPGALTFLVAPPDANWESLVTVRGREGANDLQRDGRLQVFYLDEAGSYRFAAVWSANRPPEDWIPGGGDLPRLVELGEGTEVAWVDIKANPSD